MIVVNKEIGETPLECLERTRLEKGIATDVPMTYAGRLDPLASGKLLLLVGDECKDKEKYLGLDKEYEIEVLFGVKTDTGDALGLIEKVEAAVVAAIPIVADVYNVHTLSSVQKREIYITGSRGTGSPWSKFCGKFIQAYPAYSSKTVSRRSDLRKCPLHDLARSGELPDEMPTKEVEIYSIEELGKEKVGKGERPVFISGHELAEQAILYISKVNGDFRQKEIIAAWEKFAREYSTTVFPLTKLCISCSSGTYMRSLAERIGNETGTVAFVFSIQRTKIGEF